MAQELVNTRTGELVEQIADTGGDYRRMPALRSINAGAVTIETERAIAETRAQIMIAKSCPRDLFASEAELMRSCGHMAMAQVAFYSRPQGGQTVTGGSIRLAEECIRVMGNIEYGHRELSRSDDRSEVEVFVWDKETNNRRTRQITVMHVVDRRDGPRPMRDQAEIDAKVANIASKQMRGLMFSMVPPWLRQAAEDKCRETLANGGRGAAPLAERVRKMVPAFEKFGVTIKMLTDHLGHPLDQTTGEELAEMLGIHTALADGAKPSEFFGEKADAAPADPTAAALDKATKADGKAEGEPPPKATRQRRQAGAAEGGQKAPQEAMGAAGAQGSGQSDGGVQAQAQAGREADAPQEDRKPAPPPQEQRQVAPSFDDDGGNGPGDPGDTGEAVF